MPVSDPTDRDSEALRLAAENGHVECAKLLLPVSDPKERDSQALRFAAHNGHAECVKLLLSVSDPRPEESEALRWALRWAATYGHVECVRMLLAVSGLLGEIDGLLEEVFYRGHAKVAAVLIGEEPRLLDKINLSQCLAAARENGHGNLASYLSAIIDQRELSGMDHDGLASRHVARRI